MRAIAWLPLVSGLLSASVLMPSGQQQSVFKSNVDLVRIDAQVTSGGRPVTGLGVSDFEVTDNGVLQPIQTAEADGRLELLLALDVSASVQGARLKTLLDGARGVLAQLRPGERAGLLTFNSFVRVRSSLTPDIQDVMRRLDGVEAESSTSMNDAVFCALGLAQKDARTLLLLFSDGLDTSSWLSGNQVIEAARRTQVVVCPVTVGLPTETGQHAAHERFLEALATGTGGRLFRAESLSKLRPAFLAVLTEFRSRYLLTYSPTGVQRDDGWHRVVVKVKTRRAEVKAKDGYFAGPDQTRESQ